jgi:hypothetical protein
MSLPALPAFPLTTLMKSAPWIYPLVETFHIWGFVLLAGSAILFDLRVLGLGKDIPVRAAARFLLPLSVGATLIVFPTGVLLFALHPVELLANRIFTIKLCLIFLAGCNALAFHLGPYRSVAPWDIGTPAPLLAKTLNAISIALWLAVIFCGRLLAPI